MRHTISENITVLGKFVTGDTVTISLYDLSDDSSVTITNTCAEVNTTGVFRWNTSNITTAPTVFTEYLWIMSNGTYNQYGKIVLGGFPDDTLADTNEMQGKLPINYLMGSSDQTDKDDEIDAIKDVTDVLPNSGALTDISSNINGIKAITDVIPNSGALTDIASNITGIKAVTDVIPNSGALTDISSNITGIKTVTDVVPNSGALTDIDSNITSIKAVTDVLPSAATISDAVWDEPIADHLTGDKAGQHLENADATADPSTVADAVWDELTTGHATSGSFAETIINILKVGKNKWEMANNNLTIFDDDKRTVLYQFDLKDLHDNPTMVNVLKRIPK